jgi:hypothetical protein
MNRQAVPPIKNTPNPQYTVEDFRTAYPYFFTSGEGDSEPLIPLEVMEMYIEFADSCIKIWRYHQGWKLCMGLFIAHFCILYMRSMTDSGSSAAQVVNAGQLKGLAASKSVGGVSVSYDFSQATQGLDNWAEWKSTEYGAQLATLVKLYSPRSIYIP